MDLESVINFISIILILPFCYIMYRIEIRNQAKKQKSQKKEKDEIESDVDKEFLKEEMSEGLIVLKIFGGLFTCGLLFVIDLFVNLFENTSPKREYYKDRHGNWHWR